MTGRFDGKVALVTGGSSGIGLATARALAQQGALVYITGRDRSALDAAVSGYESMLRPVVADSARLHDLERLGARIAGEAGHLDIVVANAGGGSFMPLEHISEPFYDSIFDVNVKGVVFLIQRLLSSIRHGASIVLISSITARTGTPAFSLYSASKAAVRALARNWILDLKDRQIRVNVVSPGPTETPGLAALAPDFKQLSERLASQIPLGRLGRVDEVARAILFLASDDASFINGVDLAVDGGMSEV
jgi:NAD(P)-dependent dehydrogenase (short-subunit alcohol dehydrogenase family)